MERYLECETTYLKSYVESSKKSEKKITEFVKADLNKQEELFQVRMMKRVKSTGKL
jgi:hypothetical protein